MFYHQQNELPDPQENKYRKQIPGRQKLKKHETTFIVMVKERNRATRISL